MGDTDPWQILSGKKQLAETSAPSSVGATPMVPPMGMPMSPQQPAVPSEAVPVHADHVSMPADLPADSFGLPAMTPTHSVSTQAIPAQAAVPQAFHHLEPAQPATPPELSVQPVGWKPTQPIDAAPCQCCGNTHDGQENRPYEHPDNTTGSSGDPAEHHQPQHPTQPDAAGDSRPSEVTDPVPTDGKQDSCCSCCSNDHNFDSPPGDSVSDPNAPVTDPSDPTDPSNPADPTDPRCPDPEDPHGHDPHGHDPHGHDPHGHDPHGHDPHGHDPNPPSDPSDPDGPMGPHGHDPKQGPGHDGTHHDGTHHDGTHHQEHLPPTHPVSDGKVPHSPTHSEPPQKPGGPTDSNTHQSSPQRPETHKPETHKPETSHESPYAVDTQKPEGKTHTPGKTMPPPSRGTGPDGDSGTRALAPYPPTRQGTKQGDSGSADPRTVQTPGEFHGPTPKKPGTSQDGRPQSQNPNTNPTTNGESDKPRGGDSESSKNPSRLSGTGGTGGGGPKDGNVGPDPNLKFDESQYNQLISVIGDVMSTLPDATSIGVVFLDSELTLQPRQQHWEPAINLVTRGSTFGGSVDTQTSSLGKTLSTFHTALRQAKEVFKETDDLAAYSATKFTSEYPGINGGGLPGGA